MARGRQAAARAAVSNRAVWNDVKLHRKLISFVLNTMGEDAAFASVTAGTRTNLEPVLKMAKTTIAPQVHTGTLRRWFYFFMIFGVTQAEDKRDGCKYSEPYRRTRRTRAEGWTREHTRKLKKIVDEHPDLYLDEIQSRFYASTGRFFSATTLWRKLHEEVGYSLKVAVDKAKQRDEEERREYQKCLEEIVVRPEQLIYIDETAVGSNASRRRRIWFRRGRTPFRTAYFMGHLRRYTMIAACDVKGFILGSCETVEREQGINDRNESRGTIDRERFRVWVEQRLVPVLGNASLLEDRSILVMDNASIHVSNEIRELIESTGARLLCLPPYSPDLNPIELMFGHYKAYLRRHHRNNTSWALVHTEALLSVRPVIARNFFRHSQVPKCTVILRSADVNAEDEEVAALCAILVTELFDE
jgi:transposase